MHPCLENRLTRDDARRLFVEGSRALARVEANGMRIDVGLLDRTIAWAEDRVRAYEDELRRDPIWATWKKLYGEGANLGSLPQLGQVLFGEMGYTAGRKTETGRPATDAESLESVDLPFVRKYLDAGKLRKAVATNLKGIRTELSGELLRALYSLNLVRTYRSSSQSPNAQNFPVRDQRLARLVRSVFIPRDDHVLVEIDMAGAEVRVSACYHRDPTMEGYIARGHDYHKDLACQCFKLKPEQVTKKTRGTAKAGFVFASFYGDWFASIASNLWKAIEHDKLTRTDGVGLYDHLASVGITKLGEATKNPTPGTFAAHIKAVYDDFWGNRFRVYSQWKEEWWDDYLKNGWVGSLTGFVYRGVYVRNEIINYPIQGASFHCLLWSLARLQEWLDKYRARSLIIGQIHDSILLDVHRDELADVLAEARRIMLDAIRAAWRWITVPLDVEAAVGETNWFEKKEIAFE